MRTLAVVPARGGSRGLPGKNARPFLGVSLLSRAIQIAQETCDDLVVTTDSDDLVRLAELAGCKYRQIRMRPAELATDEAPMLPVVQDAIRGREGDVIVLLQPTQPLRTKADILAAFALLPGAESVVSVRRVPQEYAPDRMLRVAYGWLRNLTDGFPGDSRRQDSAPAYVRDGTVYVTRRNVVERGSLYGWDCRPLILSGDALSIDTLEDFERLEALARRSHGEEKAQAQAEAGVLAPPRWW